MEHAVSLYVRKLDFWIIEESAPWGERQQGYESVDVADRPTMTKNASRTKSPMAMSLNSVAWGKSGQS